MANGWHPTPFGELLTGISRPEPIKRDQIYRILGMRWYAKGLFAKEDKPGHIIQANELFRVDKGDFVYNRLFAWKGSFGIVDETSDGGYVSGEFPCFRIITELLEPKYLLFYLSQEPVWNEISRRSSGQTNISRLRLKVPDFLAMEIPLPPLDVQRRIVERIDGLARRVEEARRLRIDVDHSLSSLIVSLHLAASKDKLVKLGEILDLYEEKVDIRPDETYPQVGIKAYGLGIFFREILTGSQTTYRNFNQLYEGAIVLSQVKGWEGAIAVCPERLIGYYASPEYRTFRCKPELCSPSYLSVLISTSWFYSKLSTMSRGVGGRRERLRPEYFLDLSLPMPDLNEQVKLKQASDFHSETQGRLDALMPSVLDRAFKGEL